MPLAPRIRVEVHFKPTAEGGRVTPAHLTTSYRPHFVVEPGQLLGVVFVHAEAPVVQPGETAVATVALMYEGVDYAALVPGAVFDLVEGSQVVAQGKVLPPDEATARFYDSYVERGEIQAEAPLSAIARYFDVAFKAGDKVLDIGAGSGRDLAVLIGKGVDAYGIEPNEAMRTFALKKHPQLAGRVQPGSLPMRGMPFGGNFDGVVCSAVLMHVPQEEFLQAWESIRRVLKPNGRVLFSLPSMRPDLLAGDRDRDGRLFNNDAADLLGAVPASLGFSRLELDAQARSAYPDITWSIYLFEASPATPRPSWDF